MNDAQTKSLSETNPSKIDWLTTRIRQQYMAQNKKVYTIILSISCFQWDESYCLILVSCDLRFFLNEILLFQLVAQFVSLSFTTPDW